MTTTCGPRFQEEGGQVVKYIPQRHRWRPMTRAVKCPDTSREKQGRKVEAATGSSRDRVHHPTRPARILRLLRPSRPLRKEPWTLSDKNLSWQGLAPGSGVRADDAESSTSSPPRTTTLPRNGWRPSEKRLSHSSRKLHNYVSISCDLLPALLLFRLKCEQSSEPPRLQQWNLRTTSDTIVKLCGQKLLDWTHMIISQVKER